MEKKIHKKISGNLTWCGRDYIEGALYALESWKGVNCKSCLNQKIKVR